MLLNCYLAKYMEKIIFLQDNAYDNGGITRVVNMLANQLVNLDYEIEIISLNCKKQNEYYSLSKKIIVRDLGFTNFNLRKNSIEAAKRLKLLMPPKEKVILVVAEIGNVFLAELATKKYKNIKKTVWLHTNSSHGKEYGFAGIGRRIAFSKFDKIITLTKEDEEYLIDKYNKKEKLTQIYNPIDIKLHKCYNGKSHKILSCGNLYTVKGFEEAIEIARYLFENDDAKTWQWDIYGEGPERNKLEEKIKKYELDNYVFLKGYNNDMYEVYRQYGIDVFTSVHEGCPMAMIEAMSIGIPIVSFDFPCGPKDMINNNKNGFIVCNRNTKEMAIKILELIKNEKKRLEFSENSDENLKEMEMTYVISKWITLLSELSSE